MFEFDLLTSCVSLIIIISFFLIFYNIYLEIRFIKYFRFDGEIVAKSCDYDFHIFPSNIFYNSEGIYFQKSFGRKLLIPWDSIKSYRSYPPGGPQLRSVNYIVTKKFPLLQIQVPPSLFTTLEFKNANINKVGFWC